MEVETPTMGPVRVAGEKLRKLREGQFLSRAELGERSGLHPDHIGRLERGTWTGGTRIDNIRKLAEALQVAPPDILADED
jgi:transcriptional regulator with XRE-family HTH domain